MGKRYDVAVVGAGIVGLAHAHSAARRGLRVAVVEKDFRCIGASIRNFGFITVTGQSVGETWNRARTSRDIWAQVAPLADIPIEHSGFWMLAKRPEAAAVLREFMATEMATGLKLYEPDEAARLNPALRTDNAALAMYSPIELRVESKTAIPKLATWLAEEQGVDFFFGETALETSGGKLRTTTRTIDAGRVIVCPGTELTGLAASAISAHALQLTRLQMLRIRPQRGFRLGAAVMSDLGLIRYGGYAALPAAVALKSRLLKEESESLAAGIHLIVVQSADGTLVVGDSHHYDASPEPFASEQVDALILRHMREALRVSEYEVIERWTGIYPTGATVDCVIERPDDATCVVVVSSGTGASTAFGIAEEVFNEWE